MCEIMKSKRPSSVTKNFECRILDLTSPGVSNLYDFCQYFSGKKMSTLFRESFSRQISAEIPNRNNQAVLDIIYDYLICALIILQNYIFGYKVFNYDLILICRTYIPLSLFG